MADNKESFNTLIVEDTKAVRIGKKVKECDKENMFSFVTSHFAMFFLDLEELRKFIAYLYSNKAEMLIDEMLKDFNAVLKDFRQR